MIAWNKEKIIFLIIRRSQNYGITKFADEVVSLVEMVKTGIPGKVQFWMYPALIVASVSDHAWVSVTC